MSDTAMSKKSLSLFCEKLVSERFHSRFQLLIRRLYLDQNSYISGQFLLYEVNVLSDSHKNQVSRRIATPGSQASLVAQDGEGSPKLL